MLSFPSNTVAYDPAYLDTHLNFLAAMAADAVPDDVCDDIPDDVSDDIPDDIPGAVPDDIPDAVLCNVCDL